MRMTEWFGLGSLKDHPVPVPFTGRDTATWNNSTVKEFWGDLGLVVMAVSLCR